MNVTLFRLLQQQDGSPDRKKQSSLINIRNDNSAKLFMCRDGVYVQCTLYTT